MMEPLRNPARSEFVPLTMAPGVDRPPPGHLAPGAKHPVKLIRPKVTATRPSGSVSKPSLLSPKTPDAPDPTTHKAPGADHPKPPDLEHPVPHVPLNIQNREPLPGEHHENPNTEGRSGVGMLGSLAAGATLLTSERPQAIEPGSPQFPTVNGQPAFPAPMMSGDASVVQTFWYD